jgi:hypothetical protein
VHVHPCCLEAGAGCGLVLQIHGYSISAATMEATTDLAGWAGARPGRISEACDGGPRQGGLTRGTRRGRGHLGPPVLPDFRRGLRCDRRGAACQCPFPLAERGPLRQARSASSWWTRRAGRTGPSRGRATTTGARSGPARTRTCTPKSCAGLPLLRTPPSPHSSHRPPAPPSLSFLSFAQPRGLCGSIEKVHHDG